MWLFELRKLRAFVAHSAWTHKQQQKKKKRRSQHELNAACVIVHKLSERWAERERAREEMRWGDGIAFINHHESSTFIHSIPPHIPQHPKKNEISSFFLAFFLYESCCSCWQRGEVRGRRRSNFEQRRRRHTRLFNKINLL